MKILTTLSYLCIAIFSMSLLYVAVLSWIDPRAVMALVQVELHNNDALSSIRGVYGGVGIFLVGSAVAISLKNLQHGLLFFTSFWLMYAFSRILTSCIDGALGEFGNTWLTIESSFGIVALLLYLLRGRIIVKDKNGN